MKPKPRNVKQFGAVGDASTDDRDAIQRAFASSPSRIVNAPGIPDGAPVVRVLFEEHEVTIIDNAAGMAGKETRVMNDPSNPDKKPPTVCCATCGSIHVEYAVWYSPNTGETGEIFGSWNAGDNTFCADCDMEDRNPNSDLLDEGEDPVLFKKLRAKRAKLDAKNAADSAAEHEAGKV